MVKNINNKLKKGMSVDLKGDFPISQFKIIKKDCGNFLHLIGKSDEFLYAVFLKEDYCDINGSKIKYNKDRDLIYQTKIRLNTSFGQKLNQEYFTR